MKKSTLPAGGGPEKVPDSLCAGGFALCWTKRARLMARLLISAEEHRRACQETRPFPAEGRFPCHPVGEGLAPPAGFRKAFILRVGFRPAGRVSFPAMGKKPKDRRGRLTSPSETSSLRFQFVLPQSPVYGRYPYTFPQNFRRAKYGSGYDSSRATGPWCGAKFRPVPFYRRASFRPAVAEGARSGVRRTRPFPWSGDGRPQRAAPTG